MRSQNMLGTIPISILRREEKRRRGTVQYSTGSEKGSTDSQREGIISVKRGT